jgi:uncharacterized radical SAM superfamily Fe-S cluster-containing enzyme
MIPGKQASFAEVDEQGRLILPPEMARQYGLTPGAKVRVDNEGNIVRLHRPTSQLTRLYVEPTDHCNLDCVTCYRNNWAESLGRMTDATYARILDGITDLDPKPTIFFGGIGEPTLHTHLPEWIKQAKDLGATVEMITNGTLLTETLSRKLIDAGLDLLWVSIDGRRPKVIPTCAWARSCPTCSVTCNVSGVCAAAGTSPNRRSAWPSWRWSVTSMTCPKF